MFLLNINLVNFQSQAFWMLFSLMHAPRFGVLSMGYKHLASQGEAPIMYEIDRYIIHIYTPLLLFGLLCCMGVSCQKHVSAFPTHLVVTLSTFVVVSQVFSYFLRFVSEEIVPYWAVYFWYLCEKVKSGSFYTIILCG